MGNDEATRSQTTLLGQMSKERALRTADWVAEFLSVTREWVRQAAAAGTLPCIPIGDEVRFDPDLIKAWVRRDESSPAAPQERQLSILAELRDGLQALVQTRAVQPGAAAVTVEQATSLLGCAKTRIFDLLKSGQLRRGKRLGRRTMVRTSSITALSDVAPKEVAARVQKKPQLTQPETRAEILRKLKQRR